MPGFLKGREKEISMIFSGLFTGTAPKDPGRQNARRDPKRNMKMKRKLLRGAEERMNYRIRVMFRKRLTSVLATVDMVLMKMSSATPTTSLRVSPTVSPVTAALCAAVPFP